MAGLGPTIPKFRSWASNHYDRDSQISRFTIYIQLFMFYQGSQLVKDTRQSLANILFEFMFVIQTEECINLMVES